MNLSFVQWNLLAVKVLIAAMLNPRITSVWHSLHFCYIEIDFKPTSKVSQNIPLENPTNTARSADSQNKVKATTMFCQEDQGRHTENGRKGSMYKLDISWPAWLPAWLMFGFEFLSLSGKPLRLILCFFVTFPWFPRNIGCCMVCKVAFKLWERYTNSSQYYSSEQTNIHYEPDEDRPDKDSTLSIYMFLSQTVHYHNIQILLAVFLGALGVDPSWTTLTMGKEKFDPFRRVKG